MYAALDTRNANGRSPSGLLGCYAPYDTTPDTGWAPQILSDSPDIVVDPNTNDWWTPQTATPAAPSLAAPVLVGGLLLLLLLGGGK